MGATNMMTPQAFAETAMPLAPRFEPTPRTGRARVAQLLLTLCPGGAEHLVIELSLRLAARHGMPVFCLDDAGALAPRLESQGIPVTAMRRRPGFRPSLAWRIANMTRRAGIDVLHCHQYSSFVYGALATLLHRELRVVYTEHGRLDDGPPSRKRILVNPYFSQLPHAICAVSEDLQRHMATEGFPSSSVDVIHNGIHTGPPPGPADRARARHALGLPGDALVVGTAARLDPVKDLGTLLDAFGLLVESRRNARLVIIGDGPEREAITARVAAMGLGREVLLTGYRADVRALLPALDMYVNSSISEGVSLTILEAMAAQLPVIATAVGGTPEVVRHDSTGVLVPARSPSAMTEALLLLAGAPEIGTKLGRMGRRIVESNFTLERMVEDYAEIYQRLAGGRSTSAPAPAGAWPMRW
jgi:glycosyltransferase involved in cell wall biosynthesis